MDDPKTAQEARDMGWQPATDQEIAAMKAHPDSTKTEDPQLGFNCYVGPCVDGKRTMCFYTDRGCTECYSYNC